MKAVVGTALQKLPSSTKHAQAGTNAIQLALDKKFEDCSQRSVSVHVYGGWTAGEIRSSRIRSFILKGTFTLIKFKFILRSSDRSKDDMEVYLQFN